jgi:hypothetical protein
MIAITSLFLMPRQSFKLGVCIFIIIFFAFPKYYHLTVFKIPNARDKMAHHQVIEASVTKAGGWASLEEECSRLVKLPLPYGGAWKQLPTNFPVLTSLQARRIYVETNAESYTVRADIFGMHSTGGRGIPFYDLIVTSKAIMSLEELGFNRGKLHHVTNLVYYVDGNS